MKKGKINNKGNSGYYVIGFREDLLNLVKDLIKIANDP
jgi:hypothetical protein